MLLSLLASCAEKKREDDDEEEKSNKKVVGVLPKELSGTEAAKLLLAKERLNANLLKREGNIFDQGVQVMNNLADTAIAKRCNENLKEAFRYACRTYFAPQSSEKSIEH